MTARPWTALLVLILLHMAVPAGAHEEGVLYLDVNTVAVGGDIGIQGARMPKEANLRLLLRGALETYPLVEVRTDSAGEFRTRLALPVEARTGRYTIVALASDGDEVGEAELVVTTLPAGGGTVSGTGPREPTAEAMELAAARSVGEWFAIALLLALSTGGGILLLTGGRRE
ncbi:MAG TPA: hypothetical protein VM778_05325 [Gemmatimonadota bacterium]|nr:hypothetical protein [Gemmatimonadota bacterium]